MTTATYKSEFLNILTERSFIHQCSDFAGLDKKLTEGVQSAYIGFDATAKSLHAGNLTGIMMLKWFQECGHKPITLMGGGTSKIGDPSFKDQSRNLMTDDIIAENMENIRKTCFTQFLNYGGGKTDALMVNNDDWLSKLGYLEFLRDYGRYFTVNRMISFDSVKTRLERESPLTLLEFNYMVMQGYDFLALYREHGTILQMGGSDQWGNIINGVDLAHKSDQAQLYALTAKLLLNPAGEKMGKTVDGAVWLNKNMLTPYDYWQWFRNTDDAMVETMLSRFTMLPMDEVRRLSALQGSEINEAKKILAHEATKLCHGEAAALDAAATAQKVFEQGGVGDDLPSITIDGARLSGGISILDLFVESGLAASKGEAKRLIAGGGAKINERVITEVSLIVQSHDFKGLLDFSPSAFADLSAKEVSGAKISDRYIKLSAGRKKHALVRVDG